MNWNDCWFYKNINDKLAFISRNVLILFEKHVPLKKIKISKISPPWLNEEVESAIRIGIDCMPF